METTVKERLVAYLEFKKIGRNKFERQAGISSGYITHLKNSPKNEQLVKILQAAPDLNRVWLLTGEGEMLVKNNEVLPHVAKRHIGIPLVSQYAQAGYLVGFRDEEYIDTLPLIDYTPDNDLPGNYLAFEVRGDSMDDGTRASYCQGDIVICREVEPFHWQQNKLHFNRRDFVIVHADGILIKKVVAHDVQKHTITIHSLNPEYPDRTIDLADVRQIFSIHENRIKK